MNWEHPTLEQEQSNVCRLGYVLYTCLGLWGVSRNELELTLKGVGQSLSLLVDWIPVYSVSATAQTTHARTEGQGSVKVPH